MVETLARPLSLWPARMAVAQPCPGQAATDASMTDAAAEARPTALDERVRLALQRPQRLLEQPPPFHHPTPLFVGAGLAFHPTPPEHPPTLGQPPYPFHPQTAH